MIPASKEETAQLSMIPFVFVLFSLFMITTAVNLQVPLYTEYAEQAGYGKASTALVFLAYVFGLIPVLLLLGGMSDRAGRKPILLIALCFSLCATLLMIVHPTIQMLFVARSAARSGTWVKCWHMYCLLDCFISREIGLDPNVYRIMQFNWIWGRCSFYSDSFF